MQIEETFSKADLQYDKFWLHNNHYIITQNKTYNEDIFKECHILIDLFCLQQMKEVAYAISEDYHIDINVSIGDYLFIISKLGIDFNLFILLAGEKYITSDYYTGAFEDCEENQVNILYYLININYYNIVNMLRSHYKDDQKLLLTILESLDIHTGYQRAVQEIETLEDMFDYPEVVKLYEWANSGFDINGER